MAPPGYGRRAVWIEVKSRREKAVGNKEEIPPMPGTYS
jgi:hypothetical protein